jgi:hypothetical protein
VNPASARPPAAELRLPVRHNGRKIVFADLGKLPKSLPAFDEPKPTAKPVVTEERGAALLAELLEPRPPLEQARLYHAVMAQTGWKPIEIARRLHQDPVEISRRWDDVIFHIDLLELEFEYQDAIAGAKLSVRDAYELFRVDPAHCAQLFAAFQG